MQTTIHATFLPHDDADRAIGFYRDVLGFEVRNDVGSGPHRWVTVGPVGRPETSVVLDPPAANPGITDGEQQVVAEMMAKGTYASLVLATDDLDELFVQLQERGAEVVQEPLDQSWGARDCAVRDPFGTLIRIQQAD